MTLDLPSSLRQYFNNDIKVMVVLDLVLARLTSDMRRLCIFHNHYTLEWLLLVRPSQQRGWMRTCSLLFPHDDPDVPLSFLICHHTEQLLRAMHRQAYTYDLGAFVSRQPGANISIIRQHHTPTTSALQFWTHHRRLKGLSACFLHQRRTFFTSLWVCFAC